MQALDKGYFAMADMEKITGLSKSSLKAAISRLLKKDIFNFN
jgi:Fic family protein